MTTKPKHIVIVEDEEHLAVGIKFNLEAEGYRVTSFRDGATALTAIQDKPQDVDLLILDLMLPGMNGYIVCETLRGRGWDKPVLILSARTFSDDRKRGFDVGANQYLSKPFELDELISRVRNLLSHYRPRTDDPRPIHHFKFGTAYVNFETFEATSAGIPIRMTPLEMKLLLYFIQHEGRVIPRQELLENVWGMHGQVQTRAPDQFIRRLRKAFEQDPANPRHFLTIRDAGYRFVAEPSATAEPEDKSE
jgi:two-component system OmpR family response regulator